MVNFKYYAPTKAIFGVDAETKVGETLASYGAKKVLVHYGSERVVKNGLLGRVTDSISEAGIEFVTLGGVVPNPRLSLVEEGVELARKENVDFILAVGGGSVLDSSKSIAMGAVYDGDLWQLYLRTDTPKSALPVGGVLTIPAAGSEMSDCSVITKEDGLQKRSAVSELIIPKFTLMNPALTLSLPKSETINGIVDMLMHTLERYFHPLEDFGITDCISEGLLKSVMENAKILNADPQNLSARENIMWSGTLAHNTLTGCGGGGGDWSSHLIEHEMSALFDVSHGAGLSTIWASWARYAVDSNVHRFAKFATNVMDITPLASEKETALAGISALENFFVEIGAPISFTELLGRVVTEEEIAEMADRATLSGKRIFGSFKKLDAPAVAEIYKLANK